jgi:beta-1,4-mannosyl-glycoprotein beta-1,4-N-acetylglucosaminyltransferase
MKSFKIFDCFIFNNETLLTKLRFNILNEYVDYFVICEARQTHKGEIKNYNFDIDQYKEFKDKIIYLKLENFPESLNPWQRQDFQRNFLSKGIKIAKSNDIIIFSDADEIPNLSVFNENCQKKISEGYVGIFQQYLYYYKLNLLSSDVNNWEGSRVILKNNLKDFVSLRKITSKNSSYPFWRIDKFKKVFEISNGGWHFSYLMSPSEIIKKIENSPHEELNLKEYKSEEYILKKIINNEDIYNRNITYNKISLTKEYLPDYIIENSNEFNEWIV